MNRSLLAALCTLVLGTAAAAQEGALELRGSGWVNSRELSLERLKGKVVVLYAYEEG